VKLEMDVRHRRGAFTLEVRASVESHTTGVFGPSGAGKTSLLFLVAGLAHPDAGVIRIDGQTLFDSTRGVCVPAHRRRIGLVFQDARLFPHLSVAGNLHYGMARAGGPGVSLDEMIDLLELRHLLERRVGGLSGGESQRVALGRALLGRPRLLCLDEPLASLDHARRRQILPFLRRVRDELDTPMLYVSHTLGELLQLTDRLLLVDRGRLVADGRYRDLALESDMDWAPELVNVIEVHREVAADGRSRLHAVGAGTACALHAPASLDGDEPDLAIAIRPSDIALARRRPQDTSIQNQLDARVVRIARRGGDALVELDAGPILLASVGERVIADLELAPGREVVCLIKANAIVRA
jgi:molybdate transport system ATP-binding protein